MLIAKKKKLEEKDVNLRPMMFKPAVTSFKTAKQ